MWNLEILFISCFFLMIMGFFLNMNRVLKFLIYIEIYSMFLLFYLFTYTASFDYSLILKILILTACETAIGLSLLVILVRNFSLDQMFLNFYKWEGF